MSICSTDYYLHLRVIFHRGVYLVRRVDVGTKELLVTEASKVAGM